MRTIAGRQLMAPQHYLWRRRRRRVEWHNNNTFFVQKVFYSRGRSIRNSKSVLFWIFSSCYAHRPCIIFLVTKNHLENVSSKVCTQNILFEITCSVSTLSTLGHFTSSWTQVKTLLKCVEVILVLHFLFSGDELRRFLYLSLLVMLITYCFSPRISRKFLLFQL